MKEQFLIRYKLLIILAWMILFLLLAYQNPLEFTPAKILMYILIMVYATYLGAKQKSPVYFKRNLFYTMIGLLMSSGAFYTYKFYQNKRIAEIKNRTETKMLEQPR